MKAIGMIGGLGPETTIEYYHLIIAAYRARVRDGSYPPLIINSIDLKRMVDLISAGELGQATRRRVVCRMIKERRPCNPPGVSSCAI